MVTLIPCLVWPACPGIGLVLGGAGWALSSGNQTDLGLIRLFPASCPNSRSLCREDSYTCQAGGCKGDRG